MYLYFFIYWIFFYLFDILGVRSFWWHPSLLFCLCVWLVSGMDSSHVSACFQRIRFHSCVGHSQRVPPAMLSYQPIRQDQSPISANQLSLKSQSRSWNRPVRIVVMATPSYSRSRLFLYFRGDNAFLSHPPALLSYPVSVVRPSPVVEPVVSWVDTGWQSVCVRVFVCTQEGAVEQWDPTPSPHLPQPQI